MTTLEIALIVICGILLLFVVGLIFVVRSLAKGLFEAGKSIVDSFWR